MPASRTAVLVAQARAAAQGRVAVGRFNDTVALTLLRPDEREPVEVVRAGALAATTGTARLAAELVAAGVEGIAARTIAIDEAIDPVTPQLVILGAGLDSRAWRLPSLAQVDVFEVDQPASQRDKLARLAARPPLAHRVAFVPVDFDRDALGPALTAAGHHPSTPTTWIWEGVIPYLTRPSIESTLDAVTIASAPGSRLIVNYQSGAVRARLGRAFSTVLSRLTHFDHPLRGEPWRTLLRADALSALLAAHGFSVETDDDLLTLAPRYGIPVTRRLGLRISRVAIGTLTKARP